MKLLSIIFTLFLSSMPSLMAGGGSFDKKKEDSYQQIVIGAVSDVRVVALIGNVPASVEDVKRSSKGKNDQDLTMETLLYTGVLNVEKVIKGKLTAGQEVVVTWSQAGQATEDGKMFIRLDCPHVSQSVAGGQRLVFGITAVSGSMQALHIVDCPTSLYEPNVYDPDDPFSEKPEAK